MKLEYSILWFDDDKEQFESYDFTSLVEEIRSWGFDFDGPEHVQTPAEFTGKAPFNDFDLIVVDYNIGEDSKQGDDFIQMVRENAVYTEIVFYTAGETNTLWESVKEKRLEGVFLSNVAGIIEKVTRVARQSVKKVVDLENMRGIVMAQVGDMDVLIKDILEKGLAQVETNSRDEIYKDFAVRGKKFHQKKIDSLEEFQDSPTIEKMLSLCDTSYPIWLLAKKMVSLHPVLKNGSFDISRYNKKIIKPRNALAHGVSENLEGGVKLFKHRGYDLEYSDAEARQIRNNLKKYKKIYEDMRDKINQNTDNSNPKI